MKAVRTKTYVSHEGWQIWTGRMAVRLSALTVWNEITYRCPKSCPYWPPRMHTTPMTMMWIRRSQIEQTALSTKSNRADGSINTVKLCRPLCQHSQIVQTALSTQSNCADRSVCQHNQIVQTALSTRSKCADRSIKTIKLCRPLCLSTQSNCADRSINSIKSCRPLCLSTQSNCADCSVCQHNQIVQTAQSTQSNCADRSVYQHSQGSPPAALGLGEVTLLARGRRVVTDLARNWRQRGFPIFAASVKPQLK